MSFGIIMSIKSQQLDILIELSQSDGAHSSACHFEDEIKRQDYTAKTNMWPCIYSESVFPATYPEPGTHYYSTHSSVITGYSTGTTTTSTSTVYVLVY